MPRAAWDRNLKKVGAAPGCSDTTPDLSYPILTRPILTRTEVRVPSLNKVSRAFDFLGGWVGIAQAGRRPENFSSSADFVFLD